MDDKLEEFDEATVTLPVALLRRWALTLDSGELNPEYVRLVVSTGIRALLDAGDPYGATSPATEPTIETATESTAEISSTPGRIGWRTAPRARPPLLDTATDDAEG